MASEANMPKWIDAIVEIDVTGDADFASSITLKNGSTSGCELVQYSTSGGNMRVAEISLPCGDTITSPDGKESVTIDVRAMYTIGETSDNWPTIKAAVEAGTTIAIRVKPDGTTAYAHWVIGTGRSCSMPTPDTGRFQYDLSISGQEYYGAVT